MCPCISSNPDQETQKPGTAFDPRAPNPTAYKILMVIINQSLGRYFQPNMTIHAEARASQG